MLPNAINQALGHVKGTATIPNTGAVAAPNNRKKIILKYCPPFTDSISEINDIQVDNAKYIDTVMPMYNLVVVILGINQWRCWFTKIV